jgi:TRAP-type C4-dicarboxylate transport system permease small subunit
VIGRFADRVLATAEWLLVAALAAMVLMVFGNVVLRYAFDSGITVSEELSRFLFVWLTFLGAVAVMRQGGHLGFDLVSRALPRAGRQACRIVSDLLMLGCCGVFLAGAWSQTLLNLSNAAPVSGLPLGWAYAAAVASAAGLLLLIAADLFAALRNEDPPEPPRDLSEPGA